MTTETVITGRGEIPPKLETLFRVLYTGSSSVSNQEKIERQVRSV